MSKNPKKRKSPLRIARISLASLVFTAFVVLLLDIGGLFHGVLGFLPKLEFWPAVLALNIVVVLLIVVVTVLFGRWYCSVLCPLGILQDGEYRIRTLGKKKNRFRQSWSKPKNWLRYTILAAFILASALAPGAIAALVEPYSIFGRMIASIRGAFAANPGGPWVMAVIISVVTFALITVLVIRGGRTWCNTICPVGSLLSIFSRWSLWRPIIDTSKCTHCGSCAKACRASCIDSANQKVDTSRCTLCLDCLDNCSSGAIRYTLSLPGRTQSAPQNTSRRRFLGVGAIAALTLSQSRAEAKALRVLPPLEAKIAPSRKVPVVPPGAGSLKHFTAHCIACHLCVDACPSHLLTPAVALDNFLQPLMNFENGFCRPECTACSQVCPTSAISPITPEQKTAISIGHAVYHRDRCVVITDEVSCGNCAVHCPTGAITMIKAGERRIPSISYERCIGCGRCEYVCPARPESAIHIEGNEIHREI